MLEHSSLQRLAITVAIGLLVACGGEKSGPTEPKTPIGGVSGTELAAEQILHAGNGAEPQTLDPHRAEGVTASNVLRDLYEGLTIEAPDGTVIPGVAQRWEVSPDGKTYTFHLRPEARWSNGDPVTAEDFRSGLQRSVDPKTLSQYSSVLEPIINADAIINGQLPAASLGVDAPDEQTVVIRLNKPTPYLPGLLTHATTYPVHRPSLEQHGNQFARPGKLVGNGAYRLDEWVVQSHIKLVRNENYRDNANTTIDAVYYYPLENQDTELKRYRAGELDITYEIPFKQLGWIRDNLGDELRISPYLATYYYSFNMTRPPFKDNVNLRRALSLAIDRDVITQKISGVGELPAYSFVPPLTGYAQAVPEWAAWSQAERVAEARRLYAMAGYSTEQPLTLELLYNTSENHKRVAAAIASMWKTALGIEARLLNQEWKVFLATRHSKTTTEVFRDGWVGDYDDPFTFAQLMVSSNGMNHPGYQSARYDALVVKAANEADPATRMALMNQAEQVLLEDMPVLPIYFYVSKHLVKPWVRGWQANIMDHQYTKNLAILKH